MFFIDFVFVSHQNLYVEVLIPNVAVFEYRVSKEVKLNEVRGWSPDLLR
jgi:hypothetical protein